MNKLIKLSIAVAGLCILQACDNSGLLLNDNRDTLPLIPAPPNDTDADKPRPPADEPVLTTSTHDILDLANEPVLTRGINLQFASAPKQRIHSFAPIAEAGSNIVRIQLREDTTANELQAALDKAKENGMIALVSLWAEEGKLYCSNNEEYLLNAVEELWLGEWLPVLAQRQFQSNLMINIASGWGPKSIFDSTSKSYGEYIDTYSYVVRRFRELGFKVPLVIDAPGCGQDYNAFMGGRARELEAKDPENNVVVSVHAFGGHWNSKEKLRYNITALYEANVPFVVSEFGGSGFGGESAIEHTDLMAMAVGDNAMQFDIPWTQEDDKAAFAMSLPNPLNLNGSTISFDVFVASDYVMDGKLSVQLYAKDSDYRFASLGTVSAKTLRKDNWKRVEISIASMEDITGYRDDGFDLSSVAQLGFEFTANGKVVEVGGSVKVDNLSVAVGGAPEPLYEANFDAGIDNWSFDGGAEAQLSAESGYLSLTPQWSPAGNNTLIQVPGSQFDIDFRQALKFNVRMMLPEDYAGQSGLYMKVFAKYGEEWTWAQSSERHAGDFTPGQWNDIVFTATNMLGDVSTANVLGIQIGGVTTAIDSPVLIDSIKVIGEQEVLPRISLLTADFSTDNDQWIIHPEREASTAEAGFTHSDEGTMVLTPDWSTGTKIALQREDIRAINGLELTKLSAIKANIFLDSAYAGSNLYLKFFFKDGDGWTWFDRGLEVGAADLAPGDWTTVELPVDFTGAADFDASQLPNDFGIEVGGALSGVSGAIAFDDIQLLAEGAAPAETVVNLAFEQEEDGEAFQFDFAGGSLSNGALTAAKRQAFGVSPFGWIATSWKGNEGEAGVLDMSITEDALNPTERGESIIYGSNGIKATSVPAQLLGPTEAPQ